MAATLSSAWSGPAWLRSREKPWRWMTTTALVSRCRWQSARRVAGHPIPISEGPRRPGDPAELIASNERARAELGWAIEFDELDAIVGSAWRWHQSHPDGYPD